MTLLALPILISCAVLFYAVIDVCGGRYEHVSGGDRGSSRSASNPLRRAVTYQQPMRDGLWVAVDGQSR